MNNGLPTMNEMAQKLTRFGAPHDRVLRRCTQSAAGCWIYPGRANRGGYGLVQTGTKLAGDRRERLAHTVVYEALVGSVPDGLELDHLCRTPRCVNPAHLEPVTHAENMRRSPLVGRARGRQYSERTHCANGHEYTPENTTYVAKTNSRRCLTCHRERGTKSRHAKAAAR
jgi:HNH endonuclease